MPAAADHVRGLGGLAAIIDRCLQKRKEERFASASELRAALHGLTRRKASRGRPRTILMAAAASAMAVGVAIYAGEAARLTSPQSADAPAVVTAGKGEADIRAGEHALRAALLRWLTAQHDKDAADLIDLYSALAEGKIALRDPTLKELCCGRDASTQPCRVYEALSQLKSAQTTERLKHALLARSER